MKVKVSKKELYECVERAVIRAINESKKASLKEGLGDYDDEDGYDPVSIFLKDKRNQIPKRIKGGGAARKAAMADIKKEMDAEKKDDDSLERAEKADMAQED